MKHRFTRIAAVFSALIVATSLAGAQGAAGKLVPANPRTAAVTEYEVAIDAYQAWSFNVAVAHIRRALAADSSFGLARALQARMVGGVTWAGEMARASSDAAKGPIPEAVVTLAMRSSGQTSVALWNTVVQLFPNDQRLAIDRALWLSGDTRVNALREVVKKFPDSAAAKYWLAYYLALSLQPKPPKAVLEEALTVAQDAMRQAPAASGSHTAVAYALERLDREDEALEHLKAATSSADVSNFAYELRAEIMLHKNRIAESRAALDSAILLSDALGARLQYKFDHALSFFHEGNLAATAAECEAIIHEAREAGQPALEAQAHLNFAIVLSAANDIAGVEEHLAWARRLGSTAGTLNDAMLIAYGLTKQGAAARKALEGYIITSQGQAPEVRAVNLHRMTGLTLLAEGKSEEAMAELRQGGSNPYAQVGIIEAYLQIGKKKEAAAERAALFARTDWVVGSTAMSGARYRALKKQ